MSRDELNELYKKLDFRMHEIINPFTPRHKDFELSCGYYNGHYHKNMAGEYVIDYFPIPVISVKGLCDIEIDIEKITVSTKLRNC